MAGNRRTRGNPKDAVHPANGGINPSPLTKQTLASSPRKTANQTFNGYVKTAGRVDFDAGPAPPPRGSTVAQAETAYLNGHTPRPRKVSIPALAPAKRAVFQARRSLETAPGKPQTRSPAPAGINPNPQGIAIAISPFPRTRGDQPFSRKL